MGLSGISVSAYSPSCSTVGTQCTPPGTTSVYENFENYECYMDCTIMSAPHRYRTGHYYPVCLMNDNPTYKSNSCNDTDPSITSSNGSHHLKHDKIETNSSLKPKKTRDMRPLSLPPPSYKSRRNAERRCYICLGLTTIAVFGFAFIIWLLFDSLEQFLIGLFS